MTHLIVACLVFSTTWLLYAEITHALSVCPGERIYLKTGEEIHIQLGQRSGCTVRFIRVERGTVAVQTQYPSGKTGFANWTAGGGGETELDSQFPSTVYFKATSETVVRFLATKPAQAGVASERYQAGPPGPPVRADLNKLTNAEGTEGSRLPIIKAGQTLEKTIKPAFILAYEAGVAIVQNPHSAFLYDGRQAQQHLIDANEYRRANNMPLCYFDFQNNFTHRITAQTDTVINILVLSDSHPCVTNLIRNGAVPEKFWKYTPEGLRKTQIVNRPQQFAQAQIPPVPKPPPQNNPIQSNLGRSFDQIVSDIVKPIVLMVVVGVAIYLVIYLATKSTTLVMSHWYSLIENLQASPKEFYTSVEQAILRRQVPSTEQSRIDWTEGGLFSALREYLRISREKHVLDICGAPYGTGFFISWWLGELRPSAIGPTLSTIALVALSYAILTSFFGFVMGVIFTLIGCVLVFLLLGVLISQSSGADWVRYVLVIPIIGWLIERIFLPSTYYRMDTALMFQQAIHASVLEVLDDMTKTKGLRALAESERKPELRDFFKR